MINIPYLGKHFLRSEGEREQEERENQTVKTKKAPLREGPNDPLWDILWKTSSSVHVSHGFPYIPHVSCLSSKAIEGSCQPQPLHLLGQEV